MSTWTEVDEWANAQQAPKAPPKPKRAPAVYRSMTDAETALAAALGSCRFSSGTFDKRFARDILAVARVPGPCITEKQASLLRKLVTRYRRQIRPAELPEAERGLLVKPKAVTRG